MEKVLDSRYRGQLVLLTILLSTCSVDDTAVILKLVTILLSTCSVDDNAGSTCSVDDTDWSTCSVDNTKPVKLRRDTLVKTL